MTTNTPTAEERDARWHFPRVWANRHDPAVTFPNGHVHDAASRRESCRALVRIIRAARATCECPHDASSPWDCTECPVHGAEAIEDCQQEQDAEMAAENAWCRAAEMGTDEDAAFERYEHEMGLS